MRVESCSITRDQIRLATLSRERAAEVAHHMAFLIEAGLVESQVSEEFGRHSRDFIASRLTWAGDELLDSIRSEIVWQNTKRVINDQGLSMSFDLVKTIAKEVAA